MTAQAFDTEITETEGALIGPWRQPQPDAAAQVYDAHASIHDDATAQKLGFKGGTIEGPTHFSQFAPLCVRVCGARPGSRPAASRRITATLFRRRRGAGHLAKPRPGRSNARSRC